jgi:hypothetical protein
VFYDVCIQGETCMKNIRLIVALVAALFWSASTLAGGHHGGGMMQGADGMGIPPRLVEKLNLSEQQKQDFLTLTGLYGPRFKEIAKRGQADRETLAALAPDAPDYGELSARVSQEAGLAAAEVVILMTELQTNVYALLNEEQQAEYLSMRAALRQRMEDKRASWEAGERPPHHGKHHAEGKQCPHHADKHGAEESSPAG